MLSRQLVVVQESERRRLASELHDQVGQMLTGLQFSLEMCKALPDDEVKTSLAASQEIVKEIIAQVREISLHLRPSLLDDMGLHDCLEWHIERYSKQTGIHVQFAEDGLAEKRFPSEIEITVFRTIQEALTNIARHAGVQEARVSIHVDMEDILVTIQDQGRGFDPEAAEAEYESTGLGGMRERVNLIGGSFEIRSNPGRGTLVNARIPTQKHLERRKNGRNRIIGR
jgi:signal transduction histidine kinase